MAIADDAVLPALIRNRRVTAATGLALIPAAIVAAPVLAVLVHVFVPAGEVWSHLAATVLPSYVTNSLLLLLGVGIGTVAIGVSTAWLVTMCCFPGRRWFEWALLIPIAIPAYVIAYTYTGLLDFAGPVQSGLREVFGWGRSDYWFPQIRTLGGAIVMMTLTLYPYVYLLARAAFLEQSVCVLEVSRTLGSGPWRTFWRVAVPLSRPGIIAGLSLALMETLNDFGTVDHFAVDTFTTGIYRTWLGLGEPAAAAQLASILMLFVFAVMALERISRGGARFHHTSTRYSSLPRFPLDRSGAATAVAICGLPILLGFLIPAGALCLWAIETAHRMVDLAFLRYAANSVTLALVTAAIAVVVALCLAYTQRIQPSRMLNRAIRVAGLGYAVPGAVIAVGVLLVATRADRLIDSWFTAAFGISTGLILTGTVIGVVFAYTVRFLAVSLNAVEASLAKVTLNMDHAARSLGRGPLSVLRHVHAPLAWGSLLTAAMLVFVDVMKELPATIIMRPFNFDTLAIRTYQLVADERLEDASTAALAIVMAGIVPVIILSLAIARSRPGHAHD